MGTGLTITLVICATFIFVYVFAIITNAVERRGYVKKAEEILKKLKELEKKYADKSKIHEE